MADGYDDTNKGVLFRNEKTKDTQPDMTGKVDVNGTEYRIAGWTRTAKSSGKSFLSLAIEPAQEQPRAAEPAQAEDPNDDIPF